MPRASNRQQTRRRGEGLRSGTGSTDRIEARPSGDGSRSNARLTGPGREQSQPPELSESEIKRWLARELHDVVASTLTTMLVEMEQLKVLEDAPSAYAGLRPEVRARLDGFQASTRQALDQLRRLVHELREEPVNVTSFVESLTDMLEGFEGDTGIASQLTASESWPRRLGGSAARNLARIANEALQNVRSHSAARSVDVSLECSAGLAMMTIRDDGVGFDAAPPSGGGFGLIGMRERTALVGGELRLRSTPGHGTTVQAIVPVERLL